MTRAVIATFLVMVGLNISGCAASLPSGQYQQQSSGFMGCRPNEITIAEEEFGNTQTWVASCRGRTFHCARYVGNGPMCSEDYQPTR